MRLIETGARASLIPFLLMVGALSGQDAREVNPPAETAVSVIALTHARLIDGRGGKPAENMTIVIRGETIAAIGESIEIPAAADVVDMHGKTVLPGFVDCHFHSINDLRTPAAFLRNGVTAFRDPGHPFRFYQAVKQTDDPMPRVFLCGAHLDAYPPIWPQQAIIIPNKDSARAAVEEHFSKGATAIKVYFRLPLPLIRAACETADRLGIPVTAHLELVKATDAIAAGIDGIEHVTSFGTSLADSSQAAEFVATVAADPNTRKKLRYRMWAQLDIDSNTKVAALCEMMNDRGLFVSPTLAVYEKRAGDDVEEFEVLGFQSMLEFVGRVHQSGGTLVAGSHTWVPHAKMGMAFHRELELLVECGMSPIEAIQAGTWNGACFLNAEDRIGSLEVGKLADCVVIDGDPTNDIQQLRNVERVMLNGVWVE